jgi:hypothetical protein
MSIISLILLGFVILFLLVLFYFVPVGMWVQGVVSVGLGKITIIDLIRMRLRKIPPRLITDGVINCHKAGLTEIGTDMLETHFLAGGDVANIVFALIAADKASIDLNFATATAIDLAGRDVKTAVQTSVYPKVIDAPVEGYLAAVAKDGIELKARARVTVRTNIPGLVGGATDETIIARVGEEVADMAMVGLSIGIIGGLIGLVLLFRLMTKTKFWKKLATPDVQDHKRGYDTSLGLEDMVGQEGVADTDLHPSGWVISGNKRIFVVSEGTFIEDGGKVKIITVDGNRVVVRKIKK